MRARRVYSIAVSSLVGAGVLLPLPASAGSTATVYVGDLPGGVYTPCSDDASDAGSVTTPYCTLTAALASPAVTAGTTLSLSGSFIAGAAITKSGITLAGDPGNQPALEGGLTIDGQHDITVRDVVISQPPAEAIKATSARALSFENVTVVGSGGGAGIRFDGVTDSSITGSTVSLTRGPRGGSAVGIVISGGSARDVVSDTLVAASTGGGVVVTGSSSVDVVADTVDGNCGTGVAVGGGSSDVRVENDIVSNGRACGTLHGTAVAVDAGAAASSAGTVIGYDLLTSADPAAPVIDWGGTGFRDAVAFDAAALGTGGHDLTADPHFADDSPAGSWLRSSYVPAPGSAALDSADSSVRNQPGTDHDGNGRVWDPDVTTTGAGSPAYADRGAYEYQVPTPSSSIDWRRDGNISDYLNVTVILHTDPAWPIARYSVDFGDGHIATSTSPTLPVHTYPGPGDYTITATFTDTAGRSWTLTQGIGMHPDPVAPKFWLDSNTVDPALHLPAQWLAGASVDFGDGSKPTPVTGDFNQPQTVHHHWPSSGRYTITVTGTDPLGFTGSTSLVADVTTLTADRVIHRVAGSDRYATAVAASQTHWAAGAADAVVLASGADYPDALAGGPLAAHVGGPLLLTDPHTTDAATLAEIVRVLGTPGSGPHKTVYVLGGAGAVSDNVLRQLRALPIPVTVQRIGGTDRFDTARRIAALIGPTRQVVVASGLTFADALAAGPLAVKDDAPILLSNGPSLDAATAAQIATHPQITAVGGPAAAAVRAGVALGGKTFTDLHGPDRYATAAAVLDAYDAGSAPASFALASGANFPDALAGGALAAAEGEPLLLTDPDTLSPYIDNDLEHWHLFEVRGTVQVFGGPKAVSDTVVNTVRQDSGGVIQ